MKTEHAIRYFKHGTRLAEALGISASAVYQWGEEVPEGRAYQIELITGGALKARPDEAGHTDHDAAGEKPAAVPEGAE